MLTEEHKEKIEYLNQYKYLNKNIDRKIESLEDWRNKIFNVTGTLSDMPRNPNRINIIEEGVVAIDEIEDTINRDINDLVNLRAEIESKINGVQDLQLREILKCRYLDCRGFEEIAYENGCSWRHTHRLHEKALDKINI